MITQYHVGKIKSIGVFAFAVYAYLDSIADEQGTVTVSYNVIEDAVGLSARTVSQALKSLCSAELITKRRRFSASSVYQLPHYFTRCSTGDAITLQGKVMAEMQPPPKANGNGKGKIFDTQDALAVLSEVTGWMAPPGGADDGLHLLGIIQAIHDKQGDETVEYLRKFYAAFRKKYPHGTRTFWLTDWAVQGRIPGDSKGKRSDGVNRILGDPDSEHNAWTPEQARAEGFMTGETVTEQFFNDLGA